MTFAACESDTADLHNRQAVSCSSLVTFIFVSSLDACLLVVSACSMSKARSAQAAVSEPLNLQTAALAFRKQHLFGGRLRRSKGLSSKLIDNYSVHGVFVLLAVCIMHVV